MRHASIPSLLVIPLLVLGPALASFASDTPPIPGVADAPPYVPGEILVKFRDGVSALHAAELHARLGGVPLPSNGWVDFDRVTIPEGRTVEAMVAAYASDPWVEYAEPNFIGKIAYVPNDPSYPLQWGPPCIGAESCWSHQQGNASVIIAVIDTGCDMDHPDLAANVDKTLDWDFVNGDADATDDFGHGTHCCGIIAADIDNAIGIAGLAQVKLLVVKSVDFLGLGTVADVVSGINYAVGNGARVLSLSLGFTTDSAALKQACDDAYANNVLVVAAAGNDGTNAKMYPAAYESVVGVAALDDCATRASYSNWGWENVELAAPGTNIYSTLPTYIWFTLYFLGYSTSYDYMSGTSMACPHVAGVAGIYFSHRPDLTASKVRRHMRNHADDLGAPGRDEYFGWGRLDMFPPAD